MIRGVNHYKKGDSAVLEMTASDSTVRQLAEISGDKNPVHLDDAYASDTVFGKRIAHGLFCLGMLSNVIGNQLPGWGAILVNQEIKYRKPVYIDDHILAKVEVQEIIKEKNRLVLSCSCSNQRGDVVLEGTAVVNLTC